MSAYDRWLEAPYTDAARRQAAFEDWAEAHLPDWDDAAALEQAWQAFDDAENAWAEDGYDDPDLLNDLREDR